MPSDLRYWSSGDYESDESLRSFSKYCMDPWDLENYAYMQNINDSQNDSLELSSEPSSYGEPIEATSSFYYAPLKPKRSAPASSRLDSEYGNAKYAEIEDVVYGNNNRCHVHRQIRNKEIEENYKMAPFSLEPIDDIPIYNVTRRVSSTPAYDYSHRRPSHLPPAPQRRMSYSYGDDRYEYYPQPIYAKLEDNRIYEYKKNHVIYDVVQTNKFKPDNFGLSRYGHLQIDYSYSWNNLDKYIHT